MSFTMKDNTSEPYAWLLEGQTLEALITAGDSVDEFVEGYTKNTINGQNYSDQTDDEIYTEWRQDGEFEALTSYLVNVLRQRKMEVLSVKTAAALSGSMGRVVSENQIKRALGKGRLQGVKIGIAWAISRPNFQAWLNTPPRKVGNPKWGK